MKCCHSQEVFTSELENLLKMLDIAELEHLESSNKDGGRDAVLFFGVEAKKTVLYCRFPFFSYSRFFQEADVGMPQE